MAESHLFFLFSIRNSLYAIDALAVNVAFSMPAITRMEEAPSFIAGVINLHDQIIPVVDLNPLFGRSAQAICISDAILVVQNNDRLIGLVVSEVCDVINIYPSQIDHPNRHDENNFVLGMARVDDRIISILDFKKLIELENVIAVKMTEVEQEEIVVVSDKVQNPIFRNRALELMKKIEVEVAEKCVQVAVVLLGQEYFGIDIRYVNEFTQIRNITPLPNCPQHVLGNMNLRGSILTVIDIRNTLGMQEDCFNFDAKVVVSASGDILVGVAVEEIDEIVQLNQSDIMPLPVSTPADLFRFALGTAAFNNKAMTILNLPEILKSQNLVVNQH